MSGTARGCFSAEVNMSLMEKIPRDFYKLFASKYTDYYMLFLTAIYEEMNQSYSVLGLTERECTAVINERVASATILWDSENYDEEGVFLTRSNMAQVCLKHFEEWGWLKQDYDETLNAYVVTFPEYSRMYVELFARLMDENDSRERESVLTIYSHLYTYSVDEEKNNEILKSALNASKRLVQMLVNMQDGMREYFDEMSDQTNFRGIQEVLVKEINNSDSRKYAILTTKDSFYRYKEAVKELLVKNLDENDARRRQQERALAELEHAEKAQPPEAEYRQKAARVRAERACRICDEAADIMFGLERQFDLIERRYNKLIEQKTIFASRAAARIRYVMQEGAGEEDRTVVLVNLLGTSPNRERILEALSERLPLSAPYRIMNGNSLFRRRDGRKEEFSPRAVEKEKQPGDEMDSFILRPLYTQKEIREFRRKNEKDGVFKVTERTVQSAEDLEKLFFVWQEATESAQSGADIRLGKEMENGTGFTFTGLEIRESGHSAEGEAGRSE